MKDQFAEAVAEFERWLWREYRGVVTGVQRGTKKTLDKPGKRVIVRFGGTSAPKNSQR